MSFLGNHTVVLSIESTQWEIRNHDWNDFFQNILTTVGKALAFEKKTEVSILLTNDESIQEINHQFRSQNKPTNVLSFPSGILYPLNNEILFLGDLAFAFETIEKEAIIQNKPFLNHMTHLTIHGILHLCGYDHETEEDAKIMETLEIDLLQHFNIQNPYEAL